MMRAKHLVMGLVVVGLLAAAHWMYWYQPRERPGLPDAGTIPGGIFFDTELAYRIWLPYPRQNLAELERALGDVGESMRAIAELTGRAMPEPPSFGSAGAPPATEMVLAVDETGERFIAAARVYPMPAVLARWAGKLAGNTLLAGGRAEIDGRPVETSWVGNTWIVASEGMAPPAPRRADEHIGSALAWLRVTERRGRIPAGEYRLQRQGRDLVTFGGDPAVVESLRALSTEAAPMPLVTAESFASSGALEARFLALVPGVNSIAGLPGAVTASRGRRRWKLPGEQVLSLVGDGPPSARVDGWKLVALDDESLAAGHGLVALADQLEGQPPLSVALWLELGATGELIDQVIEALEAVPFIGRREARRWRSAAEVLAPLADYKRLTAFVCADPPAVMARLESVSRQDGSAASN